MTAGLVTIFLASVLGSLHCAGMCGVFLGIALGDSGSRFGSQAAYHAGRLVTYLTLGVAAGLVGRALDLGTALAGLSPVAAGLAGAVMVAFGVVSFLQWAGRSVHLRPPAFLAAISGRGYRFAMNRGPVPRAAMIGLLTTLLPCGWLYVFVAAAAGTASPWSGGLSMAAFWLGTLPVMVSLGVGLRSLAPVFGSTLRLVTCVAMVVVGLWTVGGRTRLDPLRLLASAPSVASHEKPSCCEVKP